MFSTENRTSEIRQAWGLVYDQDNVLPNVYLTEEKGTFWLSRKSTVFKENNAKYVKKIKNVKIFKIQQSTNRAKDDITITIQPENTHGMEVFVNGDAIHQRKEIGNGRCEITLKNLNINLIFEAFCDVTDNRELKKIGTNYRYINVLGKGGFAKVYKGLNVDGETFCAIKMARYEERDARLDREAYILRKMDHPNIIKVLGFEKVGKSSFFITENAAGGSLDYRIKSGDEISEAFGKRIFNHLLSAFKYIHHRNIIHRDLKPPNIVLTTTDDETCVAKVIDFGLACHIGEVNEHNFIVGDFSCMAPEILLKKMRKLDTPYTKAVDVWGIGVCYFMTLNKHKPFTYDDDLVEYRNSMRNAKVTFRALESFKRLSVETQFFIETCLEFDGKKRPPVSTLLEWTGHIDSLEQE